MITLNKSGRIPCFESDMISVPHGFTTRLGGVSKQKEYSSLNLGVRTEDDIENVRQNYRLLKETFSVDKLILAKQEHTDKVIAVGKEELGTGEIDSPSFPFGVDGLVTDVPGIALGVFTADCVPVLLHDSKRGVIGAVHSGWRGTVKKIILRAIELMQEKYGCEPSDITAAIGPSIRKCCFEIGEDTASLIRESYPDFYSEILTPSGEKFFADTILCIEHDLKAVGVNRIDKSNVCTHCQNHLMFSHRQGDKARQLGIIINKP